MQMDVLVDALATAVALIVWIACVAFHLFLVSAFVIFVLYIFAKSCDCCFTLLGGGDCACIVIVFGIGVLFLVGVASNSTGSSSL